MGTSPKGNSYNRVGKGVPLLNGQKSLAPNTPRLFNGPPIPIGNVVRDSSGSRVRRVRGREFAVREFRGSSGDIISISWRASLPRHKMSIMSPESCAESCVIKGEESSLATNWAPSVCKKGEKTCEIHGDLAPSAVLHYGDRVNSPKASKPGWFGLLRVPHFPFERRKRCERETQRAAAGLRRERRRHEPLHKLKAPQF